MEYLAERLGGRYEAVAALHHCNEGLEVVLEVLDAWRRVVFVDVAAEEHMCFLHEL